MANPYSTFDVLLKLGADFGNDPGLNIVPADDTESRISRLAKLFLHHLYLTYDWEFNLVTNVAWTIAQGATTVSLAAQTLYSRMDQVLITSPAGENPRPLIELPWKDINANIQRDLSYGTSVQGVPQYMHVLPDKSAFTVWPVPMKTYSGLYSYYKVPDVSTYTVGTALPFEDSNGLVTALAEICQRWDKENRSTLMQQIAQQFYADYRQAYEDEGRVSNKSWRWGPKFVKKSSN